VNEKAELAWWAWTLIAAVLIGQGTCLFLHARSRGRKAWFWGIWGLIQFPWPSVLYGFLIWRNNRKRGRVPAGDRIEEGGSE